MHFRHIVCAAQASSDPCKLDSHAYTCVAETNTLLVAHDDCTISAHAYSGKYEPINDVQIGTVATLWIDPDSGCSYISVIHEVLYFGDRLAETLINPNQLHANGL